MHFIESNINLNVFWYDDINNNFNIWPENI